MTTGVAATAVAPGAAEVGHAPGWKHPLPAMVMVDAKTDSGSSRLKNEWPGPFLPGWEQK